MQVILGSHNYRLKAGAILTIGNFDGLHLGHRQLIGHVLEFANLYNKPSVLLTFEPHPLRVLYPQKNHFRICSLESTKELLSQTGLDALVVEPFTLSFSKLSPEKFIEKTIVAHIKPSMIIIGHDFRFGIRNQGSYNVLKSLERKCNFSVKKIPAVKKKDHVISSSFIKKLIASGQWDLIPELLGRFFSIKGQVIKGQGLGSQVGIPTINLKVDTEQIIPMDGVYITLVKQKNQVFQSVMNIGTNPTISNDRMKKIEIHLIDKEIQWMDPKCEVQVLSYLRQEINFSGLSALVTQIKKDIKEAKKYFKVTADLPI